MTQHWGNITWLFLHTFAEKIKETEFLNIKNDIINIIKNLCNNLPCPDCSEHATNLLKKVNFNKINNKYDFIIFLVEFHNIVNKKIKKDSIDYKDIVDKYKNNNLQLIVKSLVIIFNNYKTSQRMMMYNFHKKLFINKFIIELNRISYALDK